MNVLKFQNQRLSLRRRKNLISKSLNFSNHLRDLKTQKTTCSKHLTLVLSHMTFNQHRKSRLNFSWKFHNQQSRHQARQLNRLHLFQLKHLNSNIHNEIVKRKTMHEFKIFETHVEKKTSMIRVMSVKSKSSQLAFVRCDAILSMLYLKLEIKSWLTYMHLINSLQLKASTIIKYATIRDESLFSNLRRKSSKIVEFSILSTILRATSFDTKLVE